MEPETWAAVGAGAATLFAIGFAKFGRWHVNCWFCNENSWVPVAERLAFTCPKCEQYNGFAADGGYDRPIAAQHSVRFSSTPTTRFCTRADRRAPPDVIPRPSGIDGNGLCNKCNSNLELINKAVAAFDPQNENNWQDELAEYKYRLDKTYPLCEKCVMTSQRQLQAQRSAFSYLYAIYNQSLEKLLGGRRLKGGATGPPRRRRFFFNGGLFTTRMHLLSLFLGALLLLTRLSLLYQVTDVFAFPFPELLMPIVRAAEGHSPLLAGLLLVSHTLAIATNSARFSLPDLLALPMASFLLISLFMSSTSASLPVSQSLPPSASADSLLLHLAISSALFVLLSAVAFLPRKRIPRTRPRGLLTSAFSVASTPVSQCSSQLAEESLLSASYSTSPSRSPPYKSSTIAENAHLPSRTSFLPDGVSSGDMGWQPSIPISEKLRRPLMERQMGPAVPSRELSSRLSSISLSKGGEDGVGAGAARRFGGGPFSSLSFSPSIRQRQAFGVSASQIGSITESAVPSCSSQSFLRQPPALRRFERPPSEAAASHFTSASQGPNPWKPLMPLLIATTFCSVASLIGVVILSVYFYSRS